MRLAGRTAIWILIGFLLVRGTAAVLARTQANAPEAGAKNQGVDPASAAFAVRFARAYLDDPSSRALAPYLAEGARIGGGRSPLTAGSGVAQAEV